ncbi:hypothetical protein [Adlercreutzia caecimuris]|uniref:Uncharacterized protein n=1 Tax=Adlercreutzia caecimuris B7 TaxID=1235794 RepID=R9KXF4_9ACTN|nr:hypothetical protein [Adlercreutzia caecimuris]EOS50973.1 hypothetical protein C811_01390 [Adlercreutzia caecimuris B7]
MSESMSDEQIVAAAVGAVDNIRGEATDEEIAAAIAEIEAERADDDDRSGE